MILAFLTSLLRRCRPSPPASRVETEWERHVRKQIAAMRDAEGEGFDAPDAA